MAAAISPTRHGVIFALLAALLFGVATPLAKLLLTPQNSWLLAALFYLGSGLGLSLYRLLSRAPAAHLPREERGYFLAAVGCGGIIAPVLLMFGLNQTAAAPAALLLNAEAVLTSVLAWGLFKEHIDRRLLWGMAAIVAGMLCLSWSPMATIGLNRGSLLIIAACLMWALDNNLTRKVSLTDATWIASVKGLIAGSVNLILAIIMGNQFGNLTDTLAALLIGFFAYGVSLSLFVLALRHLGTARAGAYFSIAPFLGAVLAVLLLGEPVTASLIASGVLMGIGVWLHLTEQHQHEHWHQPLAHEHWHRHDAHHQHHHDESVAPDILHRHPHIHEPLLHRHAHYPDAHHRHSHSSTEKQHNHE